MATKLTIKVDGDTKDFQNALKDVEKETKGLQDKLTSIAKKSAVAFAGLTATIGGLVMMYREQEVAEQKLTQVLKSTQNAAGLTKDELVKMANELQRVTLFGDETTLAGQALLLTFTQIGRDTFPLAIEASMNMATVMGTDLNSAILLVGKALNDPIKGVASLARNGVKLNENQLKLIKNFVELGDAASAQKIILKELEVQFGGQAKAAAEGTGRILQLQGAIGDLGQAIGKQLIKPLSQMAKWLNDKILKALDSNGRSIGTVVSRIILFSTNLVLLTGGLALAGKALIAFRAFVIATDRSVLILSKSFKKTLAGIALVVVSEAITRFQLNFAENMEKVEKIWGQTWKSVFEVFVEFMTRWEAIKVKFAYMLRNIMRPMVLKESFQQIKKIAEVGLENIKNEVVGGTEKIGAAVDEVTKRYNKKRKLTIIEVGAAEAELQFEVYQSALEARLAHYEIMREALGENLANELLDHEEFNTLMGEKTTEQRTKIIAELSAFQLTKKKLEDKDTLDRIKKKIKEKNDELKYEHDHKVKLVGMQKVYYKTMKFLDNSRLKEATSFASQFNAMAGSKNKELRAIAKVAANVQIVANTAAAASSAMAGSVKFFGIPAGPIIGAVLAAAQIAFGVEQLHRLNAQKLADGGVVSGGLKGIDSVPAMLMPGELVVPTKNFDETVNAVGAGRDEEIFGGESGTQVLIGFDGEEASQVLTARQIENQALGISLEEAA